MIHQTKFGYTTIPYKIIKTNRRKTSQITVGKNGVMVRVPLTKSDKEIISIVKTKAQWIYTKQLEFENLSKRHIISKKYTRSFVLTRVKHYSNLLQVNPKRIVFKKLKTRWGSATKDNIINFNIDLLKAPKGVIDYVVLHELCHIEIHDHSHRFWSFLRKFMPNYEYQKKWLDLNGKVIL